MAVEVQIPPMSMRLMRLKMLRLMHSNLLLMKHLNLQHSKLRLMLQNLPRSMPLAPLLPLPLELLRSPLFELLLLLIVGILGMPLNYR
jgi:hypothetical protein